MKFLRFHSRSQFRALTTIKSKTTSKKIIIGTGIGLCTGLVAYLYTKNSKPTAPTKMRMLPPVDQKLSMDQVVEKLKGKQYSINPKTASVVRMDINTVASNNPCEDYHSEHLVDNGVIVGIYDGHGGAECGALVAKYIGAYVAGYIKNNITKSQDKSRHESIKQAMKDAFVQLDADICQGALHSVPLVGSWNPFANSHVEYQKILANLRAASSGSCALVAYIEEKDIYVASVGDCRAVIGRRMGVDKTGDDVYQAIELTKDQTGTSPTEYSRLCEEHPGEEDTVIIRGRVLGGLQPTRAFGIFD